MGWGGGPEKGGDIRRELHPGQITGTRVDWEVVPSMGWGGVTRCLGQGQTLPVCDAPLSVYVYVRWLWQESRRRAGQVSVCPHDAQPA